MRKSNQPNNQGKHATFGKTKNCSGEWSEALDALAAPKKGQNATLGQTLQPSQRNFPNTQQQWNRARAVFVELAQAMLAVAAGTIAAFSFKIPIEKIPLAALSLAVVVCVQRAKASEERLKTLQKQYQAELSDKEEQLTFYRQSHAHLVEVCSLLARRNVNVYEAKPARQCNSGKLVILKIGQGDFNTGFPVTLQIGADGDRPYTEKLAHLPPAPEIPKYYNHWRSLYSQIGQSWRIRIAADQVTNVSPIEDCRASARMLSFGLNNWLNSEQFRPLKEALLAQLAPSEEIRTLVQTDNRLLRRLPWQVWDFFENYRQTEVALSAPEYDRVEKSASEGFVTKIRILAILGNSEGIDIQKDRDLLWQLPDAEPTTFLVEPKRRDIDVQLWDEAGWDILFFAGHSSSYSKTSCLSINPTECLTIKELKYALRAAVERGLQLAIFNSCDGLGLAGDLADLQIPQIIVMREPVPDAVAAAFLKDFITAFAGGKSLYASVREAREKLYGLEDEFPLASWLPVICQHPAAMPVTWEKLRGGPLG